MKKKIYLFIAFLCINSAFAQSPHDVRLYGLTQYGGTDHKGTIFHYNPGTHTIQVDYEFKIKVKGAVPKCNIVTDHNGKYYGTTTAGGNNNAGVIFNWDSLTGDYSELYHFSGSDGSDARGEMVLYNGKFYGMTNLGGANSCGVIYEWDPATNIYSKKLDMDSTNGKNPDGSLTLVGNIFYGITRYGGSNNRGVLFEWDPAANLYTKQYDFDSTNGSNPVGKLVEYNGKLYGMTNLGGANDKGVIYEWNYATDLYTKKITFSGTNGAYPLGYLTLYGTKFYGLTYEGGAYETSATYDHYGVLFEWNPSTNVFVKKRDLGATLFGQQSTHGSIGSLTLQGDVLWGSTTEGLGGGAIFSWNILTSTWTDYFKNHYVVLGYNHLENEDFFQAPGNNQCGAFLLSGNKLIGASSTDGGGNKGCIYEYLIDSNRITRSVHMEAADGAYPKGSLSRVGNKLYGVTYLGGEKHFGNIFEWDMSIGQYTERFEFDGYHTGGIPAANLNYYNGKFYGFEKFGPSKNYALWSGWSMRYTPNIFSWDPVTNVYEMKLPNTIGINTFVPLELHDGSFYTIANVTSNGSIAVYNPDSNTVVDTAFFNGANGNFFCPQGVAPANGLVHYNGKFYGMSPSGGAGSPNTKGNIYEWDPVTNVITNKIDFADSMGVMPLGGLTLVGTVFYGLTSGLPLNTSTLFKWDPATNVFEKKADMPATSLSGAIINPKGTLTYSGSKLYGLSYGYELHNSAGNAVLYPGSVFEFDVAADSLTHIVPFSYYGGQPNSGVNPAYTKLLEVIPNELPVLADVPASQVICNNQADSASFKITDADQDTMSFVIACSNSTLVPLANISISNVDSIYTIHYSRAANETGSATISVTATDGYGGEVSFSFVVATQLNMGVVQNGALLTVAQNAATYQWINCNNNTPIAGATSQSYTPATSGNYAVVVTDTICSDTSACYTVVIPGINETTSENISLFPNPVTTEFTILFSEQQQHTTIKLYNTLGTLVMEKADFAGDHFRFNMATQPAGFYILEVENSESVVRIKLLKN